MVLASQGSINPESVPGMLAGVFFIALLGGMLITTVLGVPILHILERAEKNKPAIAAIVGGLAALSVNVALWRTLEVWEIHLFVVALGVLCGGIASKVSRSNKALQGDGPRPAGSARA